MIGALVESDKPVVVNLVLEEVIVVPSTEWKPIGRDIRPNCTFRKTGTEYIFVKDWHRRHRTFLLIANEDNTEIYLMELLEL
jgi:hypothetical protein